MDSFAATQKSEQFPLKTRLRCDEVDACQATGVGETTGVLAFFPTAGQECLTSGSARLRSIGISVKRHQQSRIDGARFVA